MLSIKGVILWEINKGCHLVTHTNFGQFFRYMQILTHFFDWYKFSKKNESLMKSCHNRGHSVRGCQKFVVNYKKGVIGWENKKKVNGDRASWKRGQCAHASHSPILTPPPPGRGPFKANRTAVPNCTPLPDWPEWGIGAPLYCWLLWVSLVSQVKLRI